MTVSEFMTIVWEYYRASGRSMPWRNPETDGSFDPYKIMVSEIMLQQTQVPRVIDKFNQCIRSFPNVASLADASLGDILRVWQGLGYNRRAKYVHQAAQKIMTDFGGVFPTDIPSLTSLPGVGINTAGAIMTYAYNKPVIFIETNIRTVLIHHFFADQEVVSDAQMIPILRECVGSLEGESSTHSYREWYWAMMDYGAYLKRTVGNKSRSSSIYTKQSTFSGSRRQVRGSVLRILAEKPVTIKELLRLIDDERLASVLDDLEAERMIKQEDNCYSLA
jgi:A/G-specific adenine glycosylase